MLRERLGDRTEIASRQKNGDTGNGVQHDRASSSGLHPPQRPRVFVWAGNSSRYVRLELTDTSLQRKGAQTNKWSTLVLLKSRE